MDAKKELAFRIVERFHDRAAAKSALDDFELRFARRDLAAAELPRVRLSELGGDIVSAVVAAYAQGFKLAKSRSEARRLVEQGSVQWRGEKVSDPKARIQFAPGEVLRLDKTRAVRVD
jgi:tyrosyl-tRNA synthetase